MMNLKYKRFDRILQLTNAFQWIIARYGDIDYVTEEWIDEQVENRDGYLLEQPHSFFDTIGFDKDCYIALEQRLLRELLVPILSLKDVDNISQPTVFEEKEVKEAFECAAFGINAVLKDISQHLSANFYYGLTISVKNFLYHFDTQTNQVVHWCNSVSFDIEKTPLYQIIEEWLLQAKQEYREQFLQVIAELQKGGSRPIKPVRDLYLKDLFIDEADYYKVRQALEANDFIRTESGVFNSEKYTREAVVGIFKRLEEAKYLRPEIPLNNDIRQRVIRNTFHVDVSERTLNSGGKESSKKIKGLIPDLPN